MELNTKYNPQEVENKWYEYWMKNGFFHSEPDDREPYCIVIPPPNVTGVLHMGHMLNNTIQDILVRRARLLGKNVCWVPGTDHASIATESKVVARLAQQGIKKSDLSREEFLKHAWEWTNEHGGIILEQLKRLGASLDWDRTAFTLDEKRSESVIDVFVDLYEKGLIYKGVRVVNWDPVALTALSDEEVIYKEHAGKLFYLKYFIEGTDKYVVVATTRPETIMGDTAVCINPNDERYSHIRGKRLIIPIVGRSVPVIEDEYVDITFGTGCLKVTPAHDINDYMLGQKHNLQTIDIFNDNGSLNEHGGAYAGMDRFEVRDAIVKDLEKAGLLGKVEEYTNKVGHSERTDAIIEPKLSMQWFLKMEQLAQPALKAVMNDDIMLHPQRFKNTYRHWMENVRDWCISRQLYWGHRIPAYYLPDGSFIVAKNMDVALEKAKEKYPDIRIEDLRQEEDCLDTWFSSWLWPISVFANIKDKDNRELKYYYPTSDLVTAPDILFFWVARMIIAGYEYLGDKPFKNVYLTGIVRDKLGRKMSKTLGNSPDPLDLIDKYGADGVRMGLMMAAPAGNDIPFDDSLCEQGRNFCNKIWNAFRLVKGWDREDIATPKENEIAITWFENKLSKTIAELDDLFSKYRLNEAITILYKLFWDDFSSIFLEIIKPEYGKPIDNKTFEKTIEIFETLLALLHPFMPFITEELWQVAKLRENGDSIMLSSWPKFGNVDEDLLSGFDIAMQVVSSVRNIRSSKNISPKESIKIEASESFTDRYDCIIYKLANVSEIERNGCESEGSVQFRVSVYSFAIPVGGLIDIEEERKKLLADLEYQQKFLSSVRAKLSNEKFVSKAPQNVIDIERKKETDTINRIEIIEKSLASLSK